MSKGDSEQLPQVQDCAMVPILEGVRRRVSNQPSESEEVINILKDNIPKEGCTGAQCEQLDSCGFIADLALKAAEICKPNPQPAKLAVETHPGRGKGWRRKKH
jgi:hypothetical protein